MSGHDTWRVASVAVIGANDHLLYSRVYAKGDAGRKHMHPVDRDDDSVSKDGDMLLRAIDDAFKDSADDAQTLQFIMYGARDFVAEHLARHRFEAADRSRANSHMEGDGKYFGRQMTMGGYDTYAYVLGTRAHVIVVVNPAGDREVSAKEMQPIMQGIAAAVSRAMCAPFRSLNDDLGSSIEFRERVEKCFAGHLPE
jgi:hypothetical protein